MKAGSKHTPETRQKMGKAHRGKNHPFWGKKLSVEHRRKISEAHKGKKHSAEHRRKIGDSLRGKYRGERSSRWKGGRVKTQGGYIRIKRYDHPSGDYQGYVYEHRAVVEAALGRYLKSDEIVHHINGIKDDIENLELVDHHGRRICPRCG